MTRYMQGLFLVLIALLWPPVVLAGREGVPGAQRYLGLTNAPASPLAGQRFKVDVTVFKQVDGTRIVTTLDGDTQVKLWLSSGHVLSTTGLGGTLTRIIPAGQSHVIFDDITFNQPETSFVLAVTGAARDYWFPVGTGSPLTLRDFPLSRAAKLAIDPQGLVVGKPFAVTAQLLSDRGAPTAATADTEVRLSSSRGTGSLGGALTRVIPAGQDHVIFDDVTYNKPEIGVILQARVFERDLWMVESAPLTFRSASPSQQIMLIFMTQPPLKPRPWQKFALTVVATLPSGTWHPMERTTTVKLSLKTGTGELRGELVRDIHPRLNQVTFYGLTYSKAERVVITATATAGEALSPGERTIMVNGTPEEWKRIPDVAQSALADWKNKIREDKKVSLEEAMKIARSDPRIDFFFYMKVADPYSLKLKTQGTFNAGTAVFFSGKPQPGTAKNFADIYVRPESPGNAPTYYVP